MGWAGLGKGYPCDPFKDIAQSIVRVNEIFVNVHLVHGFIDFYLFHFFNKEVLIWKFLCPHNLY